jgi:protocatechuate 3,4-dioxygenase beta subunit
MKPTPTPSATSSPQRTAAVAGARTGGATIRGYRANDAGTEPDYLYPPYASTQKRAPSSPLVRLQPSLSEVTGPLFGFDRIMANDFDLTLQHAGAPIGERIVVSGRVLDANAKPVPHTLVEIWQANSAGRYPHPRDTHDAPTDPNFTGCGRTLTDAEGRYRFVTIRPGEYPWRNHPNAWRPAHIHFSLFGPAFATRLVTQMYFPGDPLLEFDPMYTSIPDPKARTRLVSAFDWATTIPETALGYRFDIVLRGRDETPMESPQR